MNEVLEQRIRAEIARLGLTVRPFGRGYLIRGRGVEMLVSNLAILNATDLTPAKGFTRNKPTEKNHET